MKRGSLLLACAAVLALLSGRLRAEDWPQFRGPNGSGVSASRGLPAKFSYHDKVCWQALLGDGVSSPVVAGGRVFTTAMTGPRTFAVYGHDAATGKPLWKHEVDVGPLPRITPPNSHASSTPAADGRRVYVYFSTLGLLALDAADGREVWRLPLRKPAYLMNWGAASSPVVFRDTVYFCMDDDLSAYLVAADAATGKVRWQVPRPDMLAGYSVPVFCEAGGRTDLVVAGTGKLKGYDPATGKERWTCNTLLRTVMTSPVVRDGVIYIAVQSYGDAKRTLKYALLDWLDTNQDGKLSRDEVPAEFLDKFDRSDKNHDGVLSGAELDTAFQHPSNMVGGGNTIQAVRGGGSGDVTKTHLLWNVTKPLPSNLSSPVVSGGRLFVVKAGGLSSCFDTATGKALWERERIHNLGDYFASPVAADGKIYVAGRNGFVVVLADGPSLKVLADNDMGGEIIATPAIADGRLFIRTRDKLYCIGQKGH
ncbi:MAG TPA: PQQ-binding-like beta-propeller repeat protein [Gemmataceae bacterium]|nr:PQQ-binding-like beta-propeller repeat protein [Gemmataceae bacterium]